MHDRERMQAFATAYSLPEVVFQLAKKHYFALPYHNWDGHVMDVLQNGLVLIDRCEKYAVPVRRQAVGLGIIYHDSDYAIDHDAKGFKSKESLSAFVMQEDMKQEPFASLINKKDVKIATVAILGTAYDVFPQTIEAKVLRASDLMGLMGPYDLFLEHSLNIKKEIEYLQKRKLAKEEYALHVAILLTGFLAQDIRLTPEHDKKGISIFHKQATGNLHRFLSEQSKD
jgi:hypothetical protein